MRFPVKGNARAGQRDFRALRHRNPALRQREGDFRFLVLRQRVGIGRQRIVAGLHGKRIRQRLPVRFHADRLTRIVGQRGQLKRHPAVAAGLFCCPLSQFPESRIGRKAHFKAGLRHAVARKGKCHTLRCSLRQRRGRRAHFQCGIGDDIDRKTLLVFPGADMQRHRPGNGTCHPHRETALTVRDVAVRRGRRMGLARAEQSAQHVPGQRKKTAGRLRRNGERHVVGAHPHGFTRPRPAEPVRHTEQKGIGLTGHRAEIFNTPGVFRPVFQYDPVLAIHKLMPGAGHGAQFRHLGMAGLFLPRHIEMPGELQAEFRIRLAAFRAALPRKGRQQRNGRIFHAVRPHARVLLQIVRRTVHGHVIAVPLAEGAGQRHIAIKGQIGFRPRIPAPRRSFLHKIAVKVARIFPAGERRIIVGRQMEPVVPRFHTRAAALMRAAEIIVEKDVPAQHEVARLLHAFRKGEPAVPKAEVADPALRSVFLAAGNIHAARPDLGEQRMLRRIPERQQHVSFPGEAPVPVELEIKPRATVVHKAGQRGLPGGIEHAHAVVQAAIQRHVHKIEILKAAGSVVPAAAAVLVAQPTGKERPVRRRKRPVAHEARAHVGPRLPSVKGVGAARPAHRAVLMIAQPLVPRAG